MSVDISPIRQFVREVYWSIRYMVSGPVPEILHDIRSGCEWRAGQMDVVFNRSIRVWVDRSDKTYLYRLTTDQYADLLNRLSLKAEDWD